MQKITDRELLAFCSLAKLKLEFSQYKDIEKDNKGKETTTYKTIRQLIKDEIDGQEVRKESEDSRIVELRNIEQKIEQKTNDDATISPAGTISSPREEAIKEEWKNYHEKVKNIINSNKNLNAESSLNLGIFYNNSELRMNPFPYKREDDLREATPMLMEYYDTPLNVESKFLENWEVVYAGDSYDCSVRVFNENRKAIESIMNENENIF
jgi:hypothetical protein